MLKPNALFLILSFFLTPGLSSAVQGMRNVKSQFTVKHTAMSLKNLLVSKNMTIFSHVKHSQAAEKQGIYLNPTELIIFGNPAIGSKLMHCSQTAAIDLPQKYLIWEDEKKDVWISYNDPEYLKVRHKIQGCNLVLDKISAALENFAKKASDTSQKPKEYEDSPFAID